MGGVIKAITGIFKKPEMPKIEAPQMSMPDPKSFATQRAALEKTRKRAQRGREGTIYTGGAYTGTNLGGTQ